MIKHILVLTNIVIWASMLQAQDGPFAPAAGQPNSTAIHKDSSMIISWAMEGYSEIGFMDINDPEEGYASHGSTSDIFGYSDNLVQSLGDGGVAVYNINPPLMNGPGPDFAVFENSFSDDYLEFAHVEASSNGVDFYRFPSTCLIQNEIQVDGFGVSDPTKIQNLAGKYRMEYGTPFDLSDLESIEGLDINNIIAIKVIDVIGNINEPNSSVDSNGNVINDPYPTPFQSSGFDLDALGLIHVVTSIEEQDAPTAMVYPNPTKDNCTIMVNGVNPYSLEVFNNSSDMIINMSNLRHSISIDLSRQSSGIYHCKIIMKNKVSWVKIVKI